MTHSVDLKFKEALFLTLSPKGQPPEMVALQVKLMGELLDSGALSAEQAATVAGRTASEGGAMLAMASQVGWAELDESGALVGMLVSATPTRHKITAGDSTAYTWCAADSLFLPAVLGRTLHVTSTCPETGTVIELDVAADGVTSVSPETAYVSLVAPGITEGVDRCGGGMAGLTGTKGGFCSNSNYFANQQAAVQWLDHHRGALVLPVEEAFELAREIWTDPYREALQSR